LFNVKEIRDGLGRLKRLYQTRGYADEKTKPDIKVDDESHRIYMILRISEEPHTP
jgi:outer membrane protein assembly factor BamA